MDFRGSDGIDQLPAAETAEDVAALYSWANLHGAKYRDFSASRREYRAHLRSKAAEQIRGSQLNAKLEAKRAVEFAALVPSDSKDVIVAQVSGAADASPESAEREPTISMRVAQAEQMEAERRRAAVQSLPRVLERVSAEASRSALRQALRPLEEAEGSRISVPKLTPNGIDLRKSGEQGRLAERGNLEGEMRRKWDWEAESDQSGGRRQQMRPQGYHPDDASGVREIYREESGAADPYEQDRSGAQRRGSGGRLEAPSAGFPGFSSMSWGAGADQGSNEGQPSPGAGIPAERREGAPQRSGLWSSNEGSERNRSDEGAIRRPVVGSSQMAAELEQAAQVLAEEGSRDTDPTARPEFDRSPGQGAPWRDRRGEPAAAAAGAPRESVRQAREERGRDRGSSGQRPAAPTSNPPQQSVAPAWLYSTQATVAQGAASFQTPDVPGQQSSVADTLQYSRERVASRWFALKGVFEQPGVEKQMDPVLRQKEIRTPVLAVFSLAGGVGKTSIVATLGRSLSALGEKVLLADTTSHGLLPYYFGASELRQGAVRTFSPPSGSTDAPIYLVSYDVEQHAADEASQEGLVEEIVVHGKGTHRIMLDLAQGSGWIAQRMMKLNPTVLVPVAADMNSVITLQAVEKFLQWTTAPDGQPVRPFYLLNQFDAGLPLHLDVREVLRRQLGDRLLPFVIRRSHAVSESLAEGMTVLDYAPDSPVVEDYQTLATWLRNVSAPATAGFRNVRWSER